MGIIKAIDFDLSKYSEDTIFVLDTNILYFVYSGYYLPTDSKCICYSNLIQSILGNGRRILVSALNLQELLFVIENKEYRRYLAANNVSKNLFTKKDYRKDLTERQNLKARIKTIVTEICNTYALADDRICVDQVKNYADRLDNHHYDPIDYILVDNMIAQGSIVFISDDKDFQFDNRIELVTA